LQLRGNNRAIVQLTSKEEFYFTKGNLENMKRCFKMTNRSSNETKESILK